MTKTVTLPAQQYKTVNQNISTSGSSRLYEEASSKSLKDVQEGAEFKLVSENSEPEKSTILVLQQRIEGQERNIVVVALPETKEDKKKTTATKKPEAETQSAS